MYKFTKANIFNEHLIKIDARKVFDVVEKDEDVIFELKLPIENSRCRVVITISDNDSVDIIYGFACLKDIAKEDDIIRLLNEMNNSSRLNFSMFDNGIITGKFEYISTIDQFNPGLLFNLVSLRFKSIEEYAYSK